MERTEPELIETIMARRIMSMPEFAALIDARVNQAVQMKFDSMHIKNYYTPEEYAEVKKIKKQTVYKLCKQGHLPHERIGNSIRLYADTKNNVR